MNPTILDVVKKEVTNLLKVDIIYPISNNSWISHVQVVMMSSNFCLHLMFKFGDLIEFLCLKIDLITICDYCIY